MKAVINLGSLVIDTKNLDLLDKLLAGAERQDYDYTTGASVYYIKPLPAEGISIQIIPNDLVEAQRLIYKLKQDAKA